MDARLLFTLIAFLGGMWAYLLQAIQELTAASPAAPELLTLAFAHFVVLVYLVLTLAVFFSEGLVAVGFDAPAFTSHLSRLVFGTWPVTLVVVLMSLALTKIQPERAINAIIIVGLPVIAAFAAMAWHVTKKSNAASGGMRVQWVTELILFPFATIVLFLIFYLPGMSYLLSDVVVEFDKPYYIEGEGEIIVCIRRGGYVGCPDVSAIECGRFRKKLTGDGTYVVPLKAVGRADYLLVKYEPQLSWAVREHIEPVNIAIRLQPDEGP